MENEKLSEKLTVISNSVSELLSHLTSPYIFQTMPFLKTFCLSALIALLEYLRNKIEEKDI